MKESIFGEGLDVLLQRIKIKKIICIAAAALAVGLNALLLLLRTDESHTLMLILNIAVDIAASWFIVAFFNLSLRPLLAMARLLRLPVQKHEISVDKISTKTVRIADLDCRELYVGERVFFLPDLAAFNPRAGLSAVISVTNNIIVEVEYL